MRLTFGIIFKLSIRYAHRRNTYYYQRKILIDLLERYGGIQLIKVNLKTTDLKQIAKQIIAFNSVEVVLKSGMEYDEEVKQLLRMIKLLR